MEMVKVRIIVESVELSAAVSAGQQPFTALVTYAGKMSDSFVGGTEGIPGGPYRVMIPSDLLKRKIRELEGKRVFASDDLETHRSPKYVGKFVSGWTEDMNGICAGKASGWLNFDADPDLVEEIVVLSRQGLMGFSYDLKDVRFELKAASDASEPKYIELTDFAWRGATILKRDAAAYLETQLAAQKHIEPKPEDEMTKEEIQQAVAGGMGQAFKEFQSNVIDPLKTELTASLQTVKAEVAELKGKTTTLEAAIVKKPDAKPDDKGTPKEGTASSTTKITASDFAASIAESMKTAMESVVKPLTDTVSSLKTALEAMKTEKEDDKSGFRQTLSANDIVVLKKYGDFDDGQEPTIENYANAISMVQQDARLSKEAKGSLVATLAAQKRVLMRSVQ